MSSDRTIPDPSRPSASVWQLADWPVMDAELARFEAQLMHLAELQEIAMAKLRRLFRRMGKTSRPGQPRHETMVAEGRRLVSALGGIAHVEDITIKGRKNRIVELGIVHH